MPIVFNFRGERHPIGSLKVREVESLEAQLGVKYVELRPLGSMRDKLAILSTFLLRTMSEAEVEKIIDEMDIEQVDELFTIEDDDLPDSFTDGMPDPKADGSATAG